MTNDDMENMCRLKNAKYSANNDGVYYDTYKLNNLSTPKVIRACEVALKKLEEKNGK